MLEWNCQEYGIFFNNIGSGCQGIVYVIVLELGLIQLGMMVVCGDFYIFMYGVFGVIVFGIGISQVCDVLVSQSLVMNKFKVCWIQVNGCFFEGVLVKDLILYVICYLGVKGGVGYVYEFVGFVIEVLLMEEWMIFCNMVIEGGVCCGYVNFDQVIFDYL